MFKYALVGALAFLGCVGVPPRRAEAPSVVAEAETVLHVRITCMNLFFMPDTLGLTYGHAEADTLGVTLVPKLQMDSEWARLVAMHELFHVVTNCNVPHSEDPECISYAFRGPSDRVTGICDWDLLIMQKWSKSLKILLDLEDLETYPILRSAVVSAASIWNIALCHEVFAVRTDVHVAR